MKIIGLCGQSGAGKTTALAEFEKAGFAVIDCDKISKEIMKPASDCIAELSGAFGTAITDSNGALIRQKLAGIAFSSPDKLSKLNRITHKYILSEIFSCIEKFELNGCRTTVIDAPTLFESGLDKACEITLAICAKSETRVERIIKRDNISREQALARINRQISEETLKALADCVIYNDGDLASFKSKISEFICKVGE